MCALEEPNDEQLKKAREIAARSLDRNETNRLCIALLRDEAELFEECDYGSFSFKSNKLLFANSDSRDQLAAEHYFFNEPARTATSPISLALEIRNQDGWRDQGAAGRFLALANQTSEIFKAASASIQEGGQRTFDILNVVQSAFPHIDTPSIDGLIALCEAQYEPTKGDFAASIFFNEFAKCYGENLEIFRSIIARVSPALMESTSSLYTMAVLLLSESRPEDALDIVFSDIAAESPTLRAAATLVLGRMVLLGRITNQHMQSVRSSLESLVTNEDEQVSMAAYCAVAEGALVEEEICQLLIQLLEHSTPELLRVLANALFQNHKKAEAHKEFEFWLLKLAEIPITEVGAINNFDHVLYQLIEKRGSGFVLPFLERWIVSNGGNALRRKELTDYFGSTLGTLLNDPETVSHIITGWLIRDEWPLRHAAKAVLSEVHLRGLKELSFSAKIVRGLDSQGLALLLRRLWGFAIHEEHLVSLTLSLLSINGVHSSVFPLLQDGLVNEIGFNFPDFTRERLKQLAETSEDSDVHSLCESVSSALSNYFDALEALPEAIELRPSLELIRKIQKQQNKMMAAHMKEAEKDSIVSLIASRVPLKAGRASFSFRGGTIGEASALGHIEHSMSLPRGHVLDAVGYELKTIAYKSSRRTDR